MTFAKLETTGNPINLNKPTINSRFQVVLPIGMIRCDMTFAKLKITKIFGKRWPPSNLPAILVGPPGVDFPLPRPGGIGRERIGCFLGKWWFQNSSQTKEKRMSSDFLGGTYVFFVVLWSYYFWEVYCFCVVGECVFSQEIWRGFGFDWSWVDFNWYGRRIWVG